MSKAAELANLIGNINAGGGGANKNVIINGNMSVAQRSTSVSSVTSGGYKALDRYQVDYSGSHAWTISQDSNTPNGFAASMKFLCTTAQALTGSQRIAFRQKIEGHNLQSTKKGTSDAESVTASFHVKSNKTGTYILEYFDIDNQRHINKAYTVDTANTWEYKTITFEADTTGTFDNDANASAQLHFWLGAGSTYTSGTLQSSWGSNVTANRAVGNVNLADTVNNYWQITGIQLEVGQNPTTFENEPFERTLTKCQRYFEKSNEMTTSPQGSNASGPYISISSDNSGNACWSIEYKVRKRADPTQTWYADNGTEGQWGYYKSGASLTYNTVNSHRQNEHATNSYMQVGGNNIVTTVFGNWKADAEL